MCFLTGCALLLRACLVRRARLAAENLALRQQLALLQRPAPRPRFRRCDRLLWVALCRWFAAWPRSPSSLGGGWHASCYPLALQRIRVLQRIRQ